jgi:hypothetical protein
MPIKNAGYTRAKINVKLNRKRQEAKARQAAYDNLTIAEKMATLIKDGSQKQRNKLTKLMDKEDAKPAKPTKAPKAKKS